MGSMTGLSGLKALSGLIGGLPSFVFDLGLCTFTAGMAKREGSGGVFAAAPIIQGDMAGDLIPDVLTFPRGDQLANPINDSFYANQDGNQGSIVFWITPEWDGNDGHTHFLFGEYDPSYGAIFAFKRFDSLLILGEYTSGVVSVDVSAWTAGTTYLVVMRWDRDNPIDGTNYGCITINTTDTFGGTSDWNPRTPLATEYIGSDAGTGDGANAIIEGLTIYRRVLWDGTYGVDAGNGDELALIYAAGAGSDPCLITGSWDVVFCLPTDSTPGALTTGTGEAWSHPHGSAEVDDTFLSEGGYFSEPYAIEYNGTSTYINCGSGATLDDIPAGGGQITVGAWVRKDATGAMWIAGKGQFAARGWCLYASSGNVYFQVNTATSASASTALPVDGKWHYVAAFYDDTAKSARVAVDGVWSAAASPAGAYQSEAADTLYFGRRLAYIDQVWDGAIGWVALWSDDHHVAGTDFIPPRTAPTPGGNLVECWHCDEGTGATAAAQVTSPGNDGTIANGTWSAQWRQEGTPVIPQSLEFDGSATILNGTSGANIDNLPSGANGFTAEGYFRHDSEGESNNGTFWNKTGWYMRFDAADTIRVFIDYDTTDINETFSWAPDGEHHHWMLTYNENGADRFARVYLDGVLVHTTAASVGNYVADAAQTFYIGNNGGATATMDGAAGWQALSDSVRAGATFVPNSRDNPRANDANMHLRYAMTDGAGTTVTDTSGNGYNGIITMGSGRWWNTPDMESDEPGARIFGWGYNVGHDAANEGMETEVDGLTAETDYVIRVPVSYGMSGRGWPYIYLWDNINAAQIGASYYLPRMSDVHTGANNSATLINANGHFTQQLVGWTCYNITDGSSGTITAVSGDKTTITVTLAGGTDNDFDTNDVYLLRPPNGDTYSSHPNATETIFVFRTPASCTSIEVRCLNANDEGVLQWHQVEVYESSVDGGDMENGAGNPWIPTGWAGSGLVAGESAQDLAVFHSGASAFQYTGTQGNYDAIYQITGVPTDKFYAVGMWGYGHGSPVENIFLRLLHNAFRCQSSTVNVEPYNNEEVWKLLQGVSYCQLGNFWTRATGGNPTRLDDAYVIPLGDVSLTVTPASEANSAEQGGIRVDGFDNLTQPILRIRANAGRIRWPWRPRHSAANLVGFDQTGNLAYILYADGNATNYILLRATAANTIQLEFNDGGGVHNVNWACAGQVVADTLYQMEIRYNASRMELYQDGVLRATINQPVAFALDPTTWTMYWGSDDTPSLEGDAVFGS